MKFQDKEYALKDFRQAKHRRDYWMQYTAIVPHSENISVYRADKVFTENGAEFDKFLEPFIEGDLTEITEAQKNIDNEKDLLVFTLEVVNAFLLQSSASQVN
jgi:hypothetical protein